MSVEERAHRIPPSLFAGVEVYLCVNYLLALLSRGEGARSHSPAQGTPALSARQENHTLKPWRRRKKGAGKNRQRETATIHANASDVSKEC